eukprot:2047996-Prymnesium_polylepis.1
MTRPITAPVTRPIPSTCDAAHSQAQRCVAQRLCPAVTRCLEVPDSPHKGLGVVGRAVGVLFSRNRPRWGLGGPPSDVFTHYRRVNYRRRNATLTSP